MRNLERRCRPFIERDQLCGPQRFSHRCSRRLYGRLIFCSSSGVFIPRRGPIRCFVLALHRSERHRTSQPRPPWHVRSCWRDHRAMVRGDRTLACELIAPTTASALRGLPETTTMQTAEIDCQRRSSSRRALETGQGSRRPA